MLSAALTFNIKDDVSVWLREDCPKLDIGGFVVGEKMETATLFCKSSTVLAGVPFANEVYSQCNLSVIWHVEEGCPILIHGDVKKVAVATVRGKAKDILLAERVSLNTLSRASGIATAARKAADIKSAQSWEGYVAGTRKTTPGFAAVEKYALLVGGVATHRMDLSQMVMLKDNHIWSAGSITNAVKKARTVAGFSMKIEVRLYCSRPYSVLC